MQKRLIQAVLLATLATISSAALAQQPEAAPTPVETRNDDRGFDWGVLGLLGLLGLIPRKRRNDVRDPRADTRTPNPVR